MSDYQYLMEKPDYDPDDYAVIIVVLMMLMTLMIVYRCKYNSESGERGEVNGVR